jgi:thioredoxin 1
MASAAVIQVTKDNFEQEVLKATVPVVVDFWAEWCGPCKMLGPVLDDIANEKGDSVKVVKVNVDEEADLAVQYGIRNIPALFYFKDGELKHKGIGVQPRSEILKKLDSLAS